MARTRAVKLLGELDDKLRRYAEQRGLTANQVIAEAVEGFLRERAEICARLAEARMVANHYVERE